MWKRALDDLEQALHDATKAVVLLRHGLEEATPEPMPAKAPAPREVEPDAPGSLVPRAKPVAVANGEDDAGRSPFERVWDRIEAERLERQSESPAEPAPERRGLDLLPQHYLVTVEDRESTVDLVPLHRALVALDGVEEITLVSFANDVPVISLRVQGELDMDRLSEAVSSAMDRHCEVITQDTGRLFLRLKAQEE